MKEYLERLDTAYNHFNNATDDDSIDIAIHEIAIAEINLRRYIKRQREKEGVA